MTMKMEIAYLNTVIIIIISDIIKLYSFKQLNIILLVSDNKSPKLQKNNKIYVQASIQKPTDNKSKENNFLFAH